MDTVIPWLIRLLYAALGIAYGAAGLFVLFSPRFAEMKILGPMRIPFGLLLIIYGIYRIYRAVKQVGTENAA